MPAALAAALAGLVADPERRAALAAGARARFVEQFSMARYLPALRHLYAGLRARAGARYAGGAAADMTKPDDFSRALRYAAPPPVEADD